MTKKWPKRLLKVFGFLILSVAILVCWAFLNPANGIDALRVSKETTYLTEPLRADGTVNYGAALNQMRSQGVTPENNFAVVLLECFGPGEIDKEIREEYFRLLGIDPLPEEGNYIVNLEEFAKLNPTISLEINPTNKSVETDLEAELWRIYYLIQDSPADLDKYPVVVAWMESIDDRLNRLVEGSNRKHYYRPVPENGNISSAGLFQNPTAMYRREVARLLYFRSNIRLSKEQVKEAWSDILAMHRISRLEIRKPSLNDHLMSIAHEKMAFWVLNRFLESSNLTETQIEQYRADLKDLAPFPSTLDSIDITAKCELMEVVILVAQNDDSVAYFYSRFPDLDSVIPYYAETINWNLVLHRINIRYERVAEDLKGLTFPEALALWKQEVTRATLMSDAAKSPSTIAKSIFSSDTRSNAYADKLLSTFTPSLNTAYREHFIAAQTIKLADFGFAIAAYKGEQGSYPEKLEQLVPQYIEKIPQDLFTLKPLIYKRSEKGVLVYSRGRNQTDDGGISEYLVENKGKKTWVAGTYVDDIAIRVGQYTRPNGPNKNP